MENGLNTAVLFIIFNRPDTTKQVFEAIRQAKPPRLYVAADGPREDRPGETGKCVEARRIVDEKIDWPCQVHRLYREKNLGCKIGVSSAIHRFFENEEEGIILEDDCLPSQSFFLFCGELLERFREDTRISSISGSHPFADGIDVEESYFFSKYSRIWGWATWKRAWKHNDVNIKYWPELKAAKRHYAFFNAKTETRYWEKIWDDCYKGLIDTWDYQWFLSKLKQNSLTVVSANNLVSNIGFRADSTHTNKGKNDLSNAIALELGFPLRHPPQVFASDKKDMYVSNTYYNRSLLKRLISWVKRLLAKGKRENIKVGILTYHNGINHGAFLQIYALQNYLKELGIGNVVINYKNAGYTLNEYKSFLLTKNPVRFWRNLVKIIKFKRDLMQLDKTQRIFNKQQLSKMKFDLVILGSDSIWNYTNELSCFDPVYFSDSINADKIISYAASFGPDTCGNKYPDTIPPLLNRLDLISVRDPNSKSFVKRLIQKDAELVLDPTFLYDFRKEACGCKYSNFILLYSLNLGKDGVAVLKAFAERNNKKLISIGYYNEGCDINIVSLSPFEWLGFIKNADMVVTSMYHGALFSIKFNKEFCSIITPYRANKLKPFLIKYGLHGRMATAADQVMNIFNRQINWEEVNEKIDNEIIKSKRFLLKAVQND